MGLLAMSVSHFRDVWMEPVTMPLNAIAGTHLDTLELVAISPSARKAVPTDIAWTLKSAFARTAGVGNSVMNASSYLDVSTAIVVQVPWSVLAMKVGWDPSVTVPSARKVAIWIMVSAPTKTVPPMNASAIPATKARLATNASNIRVVPQKVTVPSPGNVFAHRE